MTLVATVGNESDVVDVRSRHGAWKWTGTFLRYDVLTLLQMWLVKDATRREQLAPISDPEVRRTEAALRLG